jgi:hypothetical protein
MTAQELFDKVSSHLLTQRRRSMSTEGMCMYRGCEGRMCAIGVLIPDDAYRPNMEGLATLPDVLCTIGLQEHYELCGGLQLIHDSAPPSQWVTELSKLAHRFELYDSARIV